LTPFLQFFLSAACRVTYKARAEITHQRAAKKDAAQMIVRLLLSHRLTEQRRHHVRGKLPFERIIMNELSACTESFA
jgi:hypothetical protein